MESLELSTENEPSDTAASSTSPEQSQPVKSREPKRDKATDDSSKNIKHSSESNSLCKGCVTDSQKSVSEALADALEAKVNLESEHSANGLTNGISQDMKGCLCAHSDDKCSSDKSSPCACIGSIHVRNGGASTELIAAYQNDSVAKNGSNSSDKKQDEEIVYVSYESELQMPDIIRIMNKDLSEPYSIYTYRYFIYNWPKLCFLAMIGSECVGAIVCKLDLNRKSAKRGYIAMLAVDSNHRNKGIGSNLVLKAIGAMVALNADEVVLESEITNSPALRLYENLGFVRDKRLFRYYLNGVDAFRLKLWLR